MSSPNTASQNNLENFSTPSVVPQSSDSNMTEEGALQHVMLGVFKIPKESPYFYALSHFGIENIWDLMEVNAEDDLKGQTYKHPDQEDPIIWKTAQLPNMFIRKIMNLQEWYADHQFMDLEYWFDLTSEEFRRYSLSKNAKRIQAPTTPAFNGPSTSFSPITPATQSSKLTTTSSTFSSTSEFTKGMKRSPADYGELKNDGNWKQWKRDLKTTAASHGVLDVLDPKYKPVTTEDINLFQAMNTFMYSVFQKKLHTSKAKRPLLKYLETMDAQKVYEELLESYEDNLTGELQATELRTQLTNMKLDKNWKSTYETFIHQWSNKVYELEVLEEKPLDDTLKRSWITASLSNHGVMEGVVRSVTLQENMHAALNKTGKTRLPFDDFLDLLLVETKLQDKAVKQARKANKQVQTRNGNSNNSNSTNQNNANRNSNQNASNSPTNNRNSSNNTNKGQNRSEQEYTTYTGPNMVMKPWMIFEKSVFLNKLTDKQRKELKELHAKKKQQRLARRTINVAETTEANSTPDTDNSRPDSPIPTDPICAVLSNRSVRSSQVYTLSEQSQSDDNAPEHVTHRGRTYKLCASKIKYKIMHYQEADKETGALLDGGANGGLGGDDVELVENTHHSVVVSGIADIDINNVPICTVRSKIETHKGPIIAYFHQYAHLGKGKTIHSTNQLRHFGCEVDDIPKSVNGKQQLRHPDGYVIPLSIRDGLAYMDMCIPTSEEVDKYPSVFFTSDARWDPCVLDNEQTVSDLNVSEEEETPDLYEENISDTGNFLFDGVFDIEPEDYSVHALNYNMKEFPALDDYVDKCLRQVHNRKIRPEDPDLKKLAPYFGFVEEKRIQKTIENTTQFGKVENRVPFRRHFKSRFPAHNVSRVNDVFSVDTFFSSVPAYDDGITGHGGSTSFTVFAGKKTRRLYGEGQQTKKQFPAILQNFIRKVGAPDGIFSDNAGEETSKAVKQILRYFAIDDMQSEPGNQWQNYAERQIQELKKMSNLFMDRSGCPPAFWLLCLLFCITLLNHLALESLNWMTPLQACHGPKSDISPFVAFHWWEPVYFDNPEASYPLTTEKLGRVVGIAENQGDLMTWLILDVETGSVTPHSLVRSAVDADRPNLRAEAAFTPSGGEPVIGSISDLTNLDPDRLRLPQFSPQDLIGKTYLTTDKEGRKLRAKIVKKINDLDAKNNQNIKMLVEYGNGELEDIKTYNELCQIVEDQIQAELEDPEQFHTFLLINGHEGPLSKKHKKYMGSKYNVKVRWENGEETWEPLDIMAKDDPVTCAEYAYQNKLLHLPGWKRFKKLAKNNKVLKRMVKQARLQSKRNPRSPKYKFGVRIPYDTAEAYRLDQENGNSLWADSISVEVEALDAYNTFIDKGKVTSVEGYKKIPIRFIFDVKHDLRHRARAVAGGHKTEQTDTAYSSVVQLRSVRIAILAGELNELETMVGDISSAYLEAKCREKVFCIAGPEFGSRQGHALVIYKALYGLRESGASWHAKFADTLRKMGFTPCKADPDVWMRAKHDHYEYVCVYVDDILHVSKNPKLFFEELKNKYNYHLKGVGPPEYHLGGDFKRDKDGTLSWGSTTYCKKMMMHFEKIFNEIPTPKNAPMPEKDHPELDNSPLLDTHGIHIFQSLMGALQWAITIGRFDIHPGVTSLSSFRVQPREGHLDRIKHIFGYLKQNPDAAIRFRTGIPNHEEREVVPKYSWMDSVYGDGGEELPEDMPIPLGKPVRQTTYCDANLMFDLVTGRSLSGILHMLNQTPVDWFCKKQNQVETATYGSEFMVARQATEQIIAYRYHLRMMGIPIDGPAWMFGDNKSVVTSSTIPHSKLNKRHNALSYHKVREAISFKVLIFQHIKSGLNPSDCLTKFLSKNKLWPLLQPLLFWKGETDKPKPVNSS